MELCQIFLIASSGAVALILIATNTFILTLYIHPDDKGLKKSLYGKIIIVVGLTLCQAQALLVPLDVANFTGNNTNPLTSCPGVQMGLYWVIVYLVLLGFVCVLIPFATFFYESDTEYPFFKRILRALAYLLITLIVSSMIIFISWNFLKFADVPYTQYSLEYEQYDMDAQLTKTEEKQLTGIQATLYVYIIAITSFVGWFLVVFFGGVGLFALPMDLINQFRNRPKVRKSEQMQQTRKKLVQQIRNLIQYGQGINTSDRSYEKNQQATCLQRFKGRRKANTHFTKFKVKYYQLNQQFSIFGLELKLADANPIVPFFKLLLGILFMLTSLAWIIQIVFGSILKSFVKDRPLIPFLNNLLIYFTQNNAGLVSTILFTYLCIYMMWCVQKGSIKMGMRIPFCCRFYPMKQHQTALNGFMVNVLFLILASVGVIQLCLSSFPTYARMAQINTIFNSEIRYMRLYRLFYEYSIFHIALIGWTVLTLLYLLITCNRPPKYMQELQSIQEFNQQQIEKLT